jgi:hypothetical protein
MLKHLSLYYFLEKDPDLRQDDKNQSLLLQSFINIQSCQSKNAIRKSL